MHCFCVCDRREDQQLHGVVMIHQSQWQQRMLELYGTDMCLLDATYNTTWYGMPLYFLCVPSNVGYFNFATMLLADDTTESIADALRKVAQWNPGSRNMSCQTSVRHRSQPLSRFFQVSIRFYAMLLTQSFITVYCCNISFPLDLVVNKQ